MTTSGTATASDVMAAEATTTPEPAVTYPATVYVGKEKVMVADEAEAAEAAQIVATLKDAYGIELSSAKTKAGIKAGYGQVLAKEIAKLSAGTWEMKELRGLLAASAHFATVLGPARGTSTLADKAQGVTSVGKLKQAIDKNSKSGRLDDTTLGEYFASESNMGMFGAVTDFVDPDVVRAGSGPDNATGIEATAIHEMAHGLVAPLELTNWVAALDFWDDRSTKSGKSAAEAPPTDYGNTNAGEDLCESVALYFLNLADLQSRCPKRAAFLAKVVAGWSTKAAVTVLAEVTDTKLVAA